MTTVTFLTEETRIVGFDARGHSGYAEAGEDIVCAAVTSVLCFCAGLTISFTLSTPVGATVVAVDLAMFLLSCLLRALAVRR